MATGMPSAMTARIGMLSRGSVVAGVGGGPEGDSGVHAKGDMAAAMDRIWHVVAGDRRGLDIWEEREPLSPSSEDKGEAPKPCRKRAWLSNLTTATSLSGRRTMRQEGRMKSRATMTRARTLE